MRLFFGIGLPSGIRKDVHHFCESVKNNLPRMKWVEEENLHVTLKFLGEVDESRLGSLSDAARKASGSVKEFDVLPGELGAFPNPKRARVLWLGLKRGAESAAKLFNVLEERLVDAGFEAEEKTYHPHITLARLSPPQSPLLTLERLSIPSFPSFICSKFTLYESFLTPKGPIYKVIEEFKFGE